MNKLLKLLYVLILMALTVVTLDKAAGKILYFFDPAFRRYVDTKSNKEKASAGEKINALLVSQNGNLKTERITN